MNSLERQPQIPQSGPHSGLAGHYLPRFVILGLAPSGFDDDLQAALRQRGFRGIAIDQSRRADRIEGVFFGRESAFDNMPPPGKIGKMLGRLGLGGQGDEAQSLPRGVIAFPQIKELKRKGGHEVIDTPIDQVRALCADHDVPLVVFDTADPAQAMDQLPEQLLELEPPAESVQ